MWSYATQTINLSRLRVSGQKFLLSGYLGGLTTQSDFAEVSVLFETAAGRPIEPGVPFQIGPVTPAQRSNISSLVFRQFTGIVPFGAAQAVVTIAMEQVGAGPADDDGLADDLNLTIGPSVTTPPSPTLVTFPYSFPIGSGGSLVNPQGISAAGGNVYVSNTADDNVADLNTLPAQAAGATTPIFAGSLAGKWRAGRWWPGVPGDAGPARQHGRGRPSAMSTSPTPRTTWSARSTRSPASSPACAATASRAAPGSRGPATRAELDFARGGRGQRLGRPVHRRHVQQPGRGGPPDGQLVPFAGNGQPGYAG